MAEKVTVLNFKFLSYIYWVYLQLVLIQNVLPLDKDGPPYDEGSERSSSVEDYKFTCIQFIEDISNSSGYTLAKPGIIYINVKAIGREECKVKLGWHQKDKRFLVSSTSNVSIDESNIVEGQEFDLLDLHLKINAQDCKPRDLISFTVIVSEMREGQEHERRGVTTIIHIT